MTESERCRNFYKLKTVCAMLRYGAVVKSRLGHTPQRLLIMAEKVPCVHRVGTKHDVCTDCCMKMTVSTIPEKNVDVSDLTRRGWYVVETKIHVWFSPFRRVLLFLFRYQDKSANHHIAVSTTSDLHSKRHCSIHCTRKTNKLPFSANPCDRLNA